MQPDKAGALGRKCVPGLKERAPCCTAADLPGPDETAPRHRRSAQNRKPGKPRQRPVQRIAAIRTHPRHNSQASQPDQGRRNKRNRDDQPDQSSRWCGPAVGRRPRSAVAESAWFGHPAAAALAGGPSGSALAPGLATRPRRSVMANRPPAAPTPTIRTYFTWPTGGKRLPRRQPARRQQRELAHSGRSEGRRLSGAAGGRRHSRTALASERVGSQRDSGRPQPMGVRRTQRHPGCLRSRQRRRHLCAAGPLSLLRNASATEELVALIVFNSDAAEPKDDIGIGQSLTAIPNDVLSAVLNVPVSVFDQIPTVGGRIVIVKRPEGQTGARPSGS